MVDPKQWPALAPGEKSGDMANIARYLHGLNFKAGIYTDAGENSAVVTRDQTLVHGGPTPGVKGITIKTSSSSPSGGLTMLRWTGAGAITNTLIPRFSMRK